jgi:hypothetical protein
MQLTFGRSLSWLDDHTAAENITRRMRRRSRAHRIDAFARPSVSATLR